MPELTPLTLLVIVLGPAVGSFLCVLIDRLPRGEDVIAKRSFCRGCEVPLRPAQMIPLASFIIARGTCGTCNRPIPAWLFYGELLSLGAGLLAVIAGGDPVVVVLTAFFLWLLIGLATADLIWFRLPDVMTAALAAVAFALALVPGGIGLYYAALGAALGAGSFAALRMGYFWLRGREGLGLGDVKLMIGLGAFAGPFDLPMLILFGALLGLAIALLQRRRDPGALQATHPIPFGTALCAAALVLWLIK